MILHSMVIANMAAIVLIDFMEAKITDTNIDRVISNRDDLMEAALQ